MTSDLDAKLAKIDADLDELVSPTSRDVYEATLPFDKKMVAAAIGKKALAGPGGSVALDDLSDVDTAGGSPGDVITQQLDGSFAPEAPTGGSSSAVNMPYASDPGAPSPIVNGGIYVPGILSNDSSLYWVADSDWMAAIPFLVPTVAVAARVNISNGEDGKKARFAIYEADDQFQPVALLWESAEIPIDTSPDYQLVTMAFPAPITFSGNYLFATNSNATAITAYPEGFEVTPWLYQTSLGLTQLKAIYRPRTYGAFPDPGDPWLFADAFLDEAFGNFGIHIVPFGLELA